MEEIIKITIRVNKEESLFLHTLKKRRNLSIQKIFSKIIKKMMEKDKLKEEIAKNIKKGMVE